MRRQNRCVRMQKGDLLPDGIWSQNVLNRQLFREAEDCGMEIELWQK